MKKDNLKWQLFMPHISETDYALLAEKVEPNMDLPALNEEIMSQLDVIIIKDEVTGNPISDVEALLSRSITPLEKEKILSRMQAIPASQRKNLSDKDLIDMLPSRYNLTLTDVDKVRDYLTKMADDADADAKIAAAEKAKSENSGESDTDTSNT